MKHKILTSAVDAFLRATDSAVHFYSPTGSRGPTGPRGINRRYGNPTGWTYAPNGARECARRVRQMARDAA